MFGSFKSSTSAWLSSSISAEKSPDWKTSFLFSTEVEVPGLLEAFWNQRLMALSGLKSLMLDPSSFIVRKVDNCASFSNDLRLDLINFIWVKPLSQAVLVAGILSTRLKILSAWGYSSPNLLWTFCQERFPNSFWNASNTPFSKVATQLEFDLCPQNSFPNVPQFFLSCHHHNHAVLPLCQVTFESLQWMDGSSPPLKQFWWILLPYRSFPSESVQHFVSHFPFMLMEAQRLCERYCWWGGRLGDRKMREEKQEQEPHHRGVSDQNNRSWSVTRYFHSNRLQIKVSLNCNDIFFSKAHCIVNSFAYGMGMAFCRSK